MKHYLLFETVLMFEFPKSTVASLTRVSDKVSFVTINRHLKQASAL
jgi:hypothetical protein